MSKLSKDKVRREPRKPKKSKTPKVPAAGSPVSTIVQTSKPSGH